MNYQQILKEIEKEIQPSLQKGKVADYIPALAEVDPNQFAMTITLKSGEQFSVGKSQEDFSIQSISKVLAFSLAINIYSKSLYKRVGVEPSGNAFNSLVQLEYEQGIPRNPFINAGAIVVMDALMSHYGGDYLALEKILNFARDISANQEIKFDSTVAKSEMEYASRNLSLAHLMKSFGNFDNDVRNVVQTYFKQCAIVMNTENLSRAMLYLAFDGTDPINGRSFLNELQAKRVNALMLTCGHYDASGEFAYNVGLPGKSGVGGGIVAVVPDVMSIAVWSPRLNSYGNSYAGTLALQMFTSKTGLSIF
ncbi:glutaminase [Sulfurovum sp. bin170]|uniref:glutaminase n=1 Tax=Sulfurovum sp. bin170 TaxID=2695268 RepID=UPI0013DEF2D6|nr:glutaminase [Sulfurovum sp. bin170]NEW60529.1 glutaminase [Sulfurovum sp. bin170]